MTTFEKAFNKSAIDGAKRRKEAKLRKEGTKEALLAQIMAAEYGR
jgi:hypothetical protein